MKLNLLSLCASIAVILFACAQPGRQATREFYVAPDGNDSAAGTKVQPVRTLARARDLVRKAKSAVSGDIVVYLRGGTYPIAAPIVFGPEDSAGEGRHITYQAYGKEVPVLSGGVVVKAWKRGYGNIWSASLERSTKLRAIYVNGERAAMAGTHEPVRALGSWGEFKVAGNEPWASTPGKTLDGIRFPASAMAAFKDPHSVELVQMKTWSELTLCVRDIVREGDEVIVKLQQPYGAIAASLPWGCGIKSSTNGLFTIRNARELLDAPGEFYFDRAAHTLFYFSKGDEMPQAEVVAPVSEGLIRIVGSSTTNRVRNLRFQGITFAHDDWQLQRLGDSHGFVGVQSLGLYERFRADGNHHLDRYNGLNVPPGTVEVSNAENIEFVQDCFENLGSACAVNLVNDVVGSRVEGNVFQQLAGNAVNVGHPQHYAVNGPIFAPGAAGICERNVIRNNLVRGVCREFVQVEAMTAFFTRGLEIAHNDIAGTPYGGIAVGWWWGNAEIPPSTVCRDNIIANNRVVDTQQKLTKDGGSIYVLGEQPGGRIEANYIKGYTRQIYPDDGSSGWTITRNVCEGGEMWFHAWVERIHDLTVTNNFTTTTSNLNKGVNCPLLDTHVEQAAPPWSSGAQHIIDAAGLQPGYTILHNEVSRSNTIKPGLPRP
ncbi:MAG: hypothetical protein RLY20_2785 [Verrucomicrobiota bacterium]|jgi:hypothetical protein